LAAIASASVAVLALLAFILFVPRESGSDAAEKPKPARIQASGSGIRLPVPAGWTQTHHAPPIPGFTSTQALVLANASSHARIIASRLAATSPTLLPQQFLDELDADPGAPQRVRLAGRIAAYYYRGMWLRSMPNLYVDVYAAPTTLGVATVACLSDARRISAPAECDSLANSLSLDEGEPLPLNRSTAFWLQLRPEIAKVDAVRGRARDGLARARTAAEQASAASTVADAYRVAAEALAPLAQSSRKTLEVVAQIKANATTYRRAASHLEAQDKAALREDRQSAVAGEDRLKQLVRNQSS
jgi:hypothetical protein